MRCNNYPSRLDFKKKKSKNNLKTEIEVVRKGGETGNAIHLFNAGIKGKPRLKRKKVCLCKALIDMPDPLFCFQQLWCILLAVVQRNEVFVPWELSFTQKK